MCASQCKSACMEVHKCVLESVLCVGALMFYQHANCVCVHLCCVSVAFCKDAKYNTYNQNIANTKYVTE